MDIRSLSSCCRYYSGEIRLLAILFAAGSFAFVRGCGPTTIRPWRQRTSQQPLFSVVLLRLKPNDPTIGSNLFRRELRFAMENFGHIEGVSSNFFDMKDALARWSSLICNPGNERTDRELIAMTSDERTRVFADLGGAPQINPEEPDFISLCLMELNEKILKIEKRDAFRQAQRTCPHYTNNPGFRIMFLRGDDFDTDKAALRIVRHFEEKLELFGPEKLAEDITLADLDEDDLESLECGGLQWLPRADQFGRKILFSRQVEWKYKSRISMVSTR